ncbi:hypothetical protein ACIREO_22350 [Streptomyces sp. NPDC102441]|uniref:hypothetical protein n=1 Tax=Streptomyces sp. NPDC102441 TaxID=3366176 RepID=UPI00380E8992
MSQGVETGESGTDRSPGAGRAYGDDRTASRRPPVTPATAVVRPTRSHTITQALTSLGAERLSQNEVENLRAAQQPDGFTLRDTRHPSGVVVAVLAAYGPDRMALLARFRAHLEKPAVGYSVGALDGLAEHEVMVRRANADELRSRRVLEPAPPAGTSPMPRTRSEELAEAGQVGLF